MSAVRTASAPSKVNLTLHVGPADESGYHALVSTFEALSLRDYVTVRRIDGQSDTDNHNVPQVRTLVYDLPPHGGRLRFSTERTEEFASLDAQQHLALRACDALGVGDRVAVTVHKTIPVAGGMAGGSADAAAALVATNDLFSLGHSAEDLQRIGATLGADVPACLVGGIALGVGRGDQMELLSAGTDAPTSDSHWWALAFAEEGLSTPAVFHTFDAMADANPRVEFLEDALARQEREDFAHPVPASDLVYLLTNDLMPAALTVRPELADVGRAMLKELAGSPAALGWIISGSGPTVAGLTRSREEAMAVAARASSVSGVRGVAVAWGPGVGAQVEDRLPDWTIGG